MLVVAFVFINLYVAVILEGFAESEAMENGSLNSMHLQIFRLAWVEFDPEGTGFINTTDIFRLLSRMEAPLGFKNASQAFKAKIKSFIQQSEMPVYME
jgi:hypothetical protein